MRVVRLRGGEGFALVLVLLALTLLAAIATAALAAAIGQLRAATTRAGVFAAQTGARDAVEFALGTTRGLAESQVGGSAHEILYRPFGREGSQRVGDLRLSREIHVFVGDAVEDGGAPVRKARLVWWMDPEVRVAAHKAVVESAAFRVEPGAQVNADSILDGRPGIARCDGVSALRDAFGTGLVPVSAAPPTPPAWGAGQDGPDYAGFRLGWFSRPVLQHLADHRVAPGQSPPPAGCLGCWSGLVHSGTTVHSAGRGAGVLVVNGDLTIASGSSWSGLVLASGDVTLSGAAGLTGLVRAGGHVVMQPGSVLDGSACAAFEALRAAQSLARPIPLPGRSWLSPVGPPTG